MDARLNPYGILGLSEGDAHVIRNAGGVVSDDAIRSLAISQNLLGTEEIILIHHTDCGMLTFTDDELAEKLEQETGERPDWRAHSFSDLEEDVREGAERIKSSPFIPRTRPRAGLRLRGRDREAPRGQLKPAAALRPHLETRKPARPRPRVLAYGCRDPSHRVASWGGSHVSATQELSSASPGCSGRHGGTSCSRSHVHSGASAASSVGSP